MAVVLGATGPEDGGVFNDGAALLNYGFAAFAERTLIHVGDPVGPLTVEGIPRGRYRMIEQKEAEKLRKFEKNGHGNGERNKNLTQRAQRTQRREEKAASSLRSE